MNLHINKNNTAPLNESQPKDFSIPVEQSGEDSTEFKRNRTEGYVIHCDGEVAIISALSGASISASDDYWAVGQMISVIAGKNRIVGLIYKLEAADQNWIKDGDNSINIHIELVGEIKETDDGKLSFKSGISSYPHMGAIAHRIRTKDLATIYENNADTTVKIGSISQDASIPALITIDKLLSRHFAVVGTTGVGKSTSVALILRKIVEQRPDIRTLILDPHNEFATAFPRHAITVDAASLDLPYWMFTLEEFVEVIYRGRPGIGEEIDALRDLVPAAKNVYETGPVSDKPNSLVKRGKSQSSYTADTPVPYRMPDLLKLIDNKLGKLEGKVERPHLIALKNRIESIMNDPRFRFMFDGKSGPEAMSRVLSHVFRVPQNGKPICVFELSGLPSEVVNVVASIMCRLAFDLGISSQGAIETLVVCEEAHRYIPANGDEGFLPTRTAIARIAKEGRKYGVYLGVITQRPSELDSTILSQCNTVFSMRLGNQSDQDIVRQTISGAAKSTASFLSSLANRECIAFGEAIDSPMRMMFETVSKEDLPGSHIYENQEKIRSGSSSISLASVIKSMRQQGKSTMSDDFEGDALTGTSEGIVGEQKPSLGPSSPNSPTDKRTNWPSAVAEPAYNPLHGAQSQPTTPAAPAMTTPVPGTMTPAPSRASRASLDFSSPAYVDQKAGANKEKTERASSLIRSFRTK